MHLRATISRIILFKTVDKGQKCVTYQKLRNKGSIKKHKNRKHIMAEGRLNVSINKIYVI